MDWWWWLLAALWLLAFRRQRKLAKEGLLPVKGAGDETEAGDGPRWSPFRERGF